jgi:phosphatidylglycerol:prolipoprotein diacylglycerol transferase
MYPILFRIGPRVVSSYTIALVAGMLAGTWMAYRLGKVRLSAPAFVLDAGFWALLGGVLGGRLGYVLANWAYYADHLDKALNLREGGLSWHGALIGGGMSVALWLVVSGWYRPVVPDWRDLYDALAPGMALGGVFGWLGCLLAGCAYGAEATGYVPPLSWLSAELPDIYGVRAARFLTQPLMIAWSALLWGALWSLGRRLPRGLGFALYLLLYALADFGVTFLRGDGTWRWGLWLPQWVALAEVCVALGIGVYAWARPDHRMSE